MAAQLGGGHDRFTKVVSSDLARATDTARVVAETLQLGEVEIDISVRERDVGDWCGRTTEEIDLIWPGAIAAWRSGRLDRPPGGEHEPDFRARVVRAVERLASEAKGPILVITHGGVIRSLVRQLGGEPPATNNLSGWWFEMGDDGRLRAGEAVSLASVPDETITSAL